MFIGNCVMSQQARYRWKRNTQILTNRGSVVPIMATELVSDLPWIRITLRENLLQGGVMAVNVVVKVNHAIA